MGQGFPGGGGGGYPPGRPGYPYDPGLLQALQDLKRDLDTRLNQHAAFVRKVSDERLGEASKRIDQLNTVLAALVATRSKEAGVVRIEDIPGRRVPYTLSIDIPIGANTVSERTGSFTISQEGPFVAVRRMCTFRSALEFQVTPQTGQSARFAGRTNGRYRPTSSVWDLSDAYANQPIFMTANPLVVADQPAAAPIVSATSSFRSMEFDGLLQVINAGSSYPRQNVPVPSPFWSTAINAPWDLGCLDFFERGEIITAIVQPTHVNNPPFGNVDGACIFGVAGWPFLPGQYDVHEGICTPGGFIDDGDGGIQTLTNDIVTRLPEGIFTVAWEGYRIIQTIAPVG
jgi:hypothetical protein